MTHRFGRAAGLALFTLLVQGIVAHAASGSVQTLRPRVPLSKPASVSKPAEPSQLVVKFRDSLRIRESDSGDLLSLRGRSTDAIETIGKRHGLRFSQLIRLSEEKLTGLEQRAATRTGAAQPDLAGMLVVNGPEEKLEQAANELLALDAVEWVDFEVLFPPPPCVDAAPATPDYFQQGEQDYHFPNPGVNMVHLWGLGARGQGVKIADCEYGYVQGMEDLCNIIDEPGQTVHPTVAANGWDDHGTAVLGEMVSLDNGYGVTGLAPDATAYFFTEWSVEEGGRRTTAVTNAIATVDPGDVVVLEMQASAGGDFVPAEYSLSVWTATRVGTDSGVIVVAAAGNGNADLDGPTFASYLGRGDSGAIIVGAGSADINHNKLSFSTYGSRVNVQGWGGSVFTTGYGNWSQLGGDPLQAYTHTFSGTSSATPIVAGVVAGLQSLAEAQLGCRVGPAQMRQLLIDTGTPQGSGGHIGPLPEAKNAAVALLSGGVCDPFCGNGIREGTETCDGTDASGCSTACEGNCTCVTSGTPGEVGQLLVTNHNSLTGTMTVSYDSACVATGNSLVYGDLTDVSTYGYSGQVCQIGNSGSAVVGVPAQDLFFLVVGHDGADVQGSYGVDAGSNERPAFFDITCPKTQDLSQRCD